MSEQFKTDGSKAVQPNIVDIAVAKKSRQAHTMPVVDVDSKSYDTVGDLLQAVRKARNLSHQDVHKKTNIKLAQLSAIEAMDLKALPNAAFVLGFIRTYAVFLELPADEVVRRFRYEADIHRPSIAPKMQIDRADLDADIGRHFSMLAVIAIVSFFLWVGFQVTRPSNGTAVIASSPVPSKEARSTGEKEVGGSITAPRSVSIVGRSGNVRLDDLPTPDRVVASPVAADRAENVIAPEGVAPIPQPGSPVPDLRVDDTSLGVSADRQLADPPSTAQSLAGPEPINLLPPGAELSEFRPVATDRTVTPSADPDLANTAIPNTAIPNTAVPNAGRANTDLLEGGREADASRIAAGAANDGSIDQTIIQASSLREGDEFGSDETASLNSSLESESGGANALNAQQIDSVTAADTNLPEALDRPAELVLPAESDPPAEPSAQEARGSFAGSSLREEPSQPIDAAPTTDSDQPTDIDAAIATP